MIRISLIIATYNRSAALLQALESVVTQSLKSSEWECVVVNNHSTDNTTEAFHAFATHYPELNLRLVEEPKQGLSHARNCGIQVAQGEILAFIDDDERINKEFLEAYLELFDRYPTCRAAGGRVIATYEESPRPDWMSPLTEQPIANPMHWGEAIGPFPRRRIPAGGNMALRREIFEHYGCFNPALGRRGEQLIGGEESDLFERLRQGGEVILYQPRAVMWHLIPARKLTFDYLDALSLQIGVSQRARAEISERILHLRLGELFKWGATLLLSLGYLLTLRPAKAGALCRMRYGISRGIFGAR